VVPASTLSGVTAILGGLGAAALWAAATLCSSRSSRMLGSRVVLAWVMLVGTLVGLPLVAISEPPPSVEPSTFGLLLLAGVCYVIGLQLAYSALRIGKVSIVAPIVATEGAIGACIAVVLGEPLALGAAAMLGVIVTGVVLASIEPSKPEVAAWDFELTADAIDAPGDASVAVDDPDLARRAVLYSIGSALVFGVGIVAAGTAASLVPVTWVAISGRLVGVVAVTIPLILARRLTVTRQALPLVVIAGVGEILGSMSSAWGARDSIAISAVMGSQFAAIAAVAGFLLFGERLGRFQTAGVVLLVVGVTFLAVFQA
jgi:drug/metabolite transporter (DMT)-like permease